MPEFLYKARDIDGKVVEGVVEATSMGDASTVLSDRNLTVITLVIRAQKKVYELDLGNFFSGKSAHHCFICNNAFGLLESNSSHIKS